MFTGIIEDVGRVASVQRDAQAARLVIETETIDAATLALGESVAVDGVCLTVTDRVAGTVSRPGHFGVYVSGETLARTTLGERAAGDPVNLERALRLGDRLGGHLVQGHVDATGTLESVRPEGESLRIRVAVPGTLARHLVEKGSIAVDGVSLTVNDVEDRPAAVRPRGVRSAPRALKVETTVIAINLVPHTLSQTALASKKAGARVNIEADMLAKHLERLAFFRGA